MITCSTCETDNEPQAEFCEGCGLDLSITPPQPAVDNMTNAGISASAITSPAYLQPKRHGVPAALTFLLQGAPVTVGRFDVTTGPVDIDVTDFPGAERVSRRHAQFKFSDGSWTVHDLGSVNGVFVKHPDDPTYSAAINQRTELQDGSEVALGNFMLIFRLGSPT